MVVPYGHEAGNPYQKNHSEHQNNVPYVNKDYLRDLNSKVISRSYFKQEDDNSIIEVS